MITITNALGESMNRASQVEIAASIVTAYLARNAVSPGDLPKLIGDVTTSIADLSATPKVPQSSASAVVVTAKDVKQSITPEYLISFEDGKRYRTLKRHLRARGMSPEQYRRKWNLPPDYPMVAASYAALRSAMAKGFGLGSRKASET